MAKPLPEPPKAGVLDVQLAEEGQGIVLRWCAHDPELVRLPSGRGERSFASLRDAEAAASMLFGIDLHDWPFTSPGRPLSSTEVSELVDLEFGVYEAQGQRLQDWGMRLDPPQWRELRSARGETLPAWLVLRIGDYHVYYNEALATYGIASATDDGGYLAIGEYGPLLLTLRSI